MLLKSIHTQSFHRWGKSLLSKEIKIFKMEKNMKYEHSAIPNKLIYLTNLRWHQASNLLTHEQIIGVLPSYSLIRAAQGKHISTEYELTSFSTNFNFVLTPVYRLLAFSREGLSTSWACERDVLTKESKKIDLFLSQLPLTWFWQPSIPTFNITLSTWIQQLHFRTKKAKIYLRSVHDVKTPHFTLKTRAGRDDATYSHAHCYRNATFHFR